MNISIIVPVFNGVVSLKELLHSLRDQDYPNDGYEIIIVDNNSKDDIKSICDEFSVRYVFEGSRQSSYAARDKGVKFSKGEVLAFIDADCIAGVQWLKHGSEKLFNGFDLVAGNVEFFHNFQSIATIYDSVMNIQVEEMVRERRVAPTANLFVYKRVYDLLKGFNTKLQSGGDIEFTSRATSSGFKLGYCQFASVRHPARRFSELISKNIRTAKGKYLLSCSEQEVGADVALKGAGLKSIMQPMSIRRKLITSGWTSKSVFFSVYMLHLLLMLLSFCVLLTQKMKRNHE